MRAMMKASWLLQPPVCACIALGGTPVTSLQAKCRHASNKEWGCAAMAVPRNLMLCGTLAC